MPFKGTSSAPFLRGLFFVWVLSDFGWFPNLVVELFGTFFSMDTFDPTLGKLIWELLFVICCVVGLPVGECDGDLV